MRRIKEILWVIWAIGLVLGTMLVTTTQTAHADLASGPSLIISQIKITSSNGQFITLFNSGNSALDMSKFQLEYFNNYDLSKATSSRLIALAGTVAPHSYFMINDDDLLLCYKMTVDSVSLGLSSTSGLVQVLGLNQGTSGGAVAPLLEDYVGWSKSAATGAQTLPTNTSAFLQRRPVDSSNNPIVTVAGTGSWLAVQPDTTNPCNLVTATSGSTPVAVTTGLNTLLPSTEPPVTIINVIDSSGPGVLPQTVALPASDIGLMAPELTEIMPNPIGTGNDATDEFIELYNPNPLPFDLSGFVLQTGTTTSHKYLFGAGTMLPPLGFSAYFSSTTHLSLSNSGGQVKLLDPSGNSISASTAYSTAKDGQSWAYAQGKWRWTTDVTPGLANIIHEQAVVKSGVAAKSKSGTSGTKAASTGKSKKAAAKPAKTKKPKAKKTKVVATKNISNAAQKTPIHAGTLAMVACLALLYVAYEYRADISNFYYQLRSHLRAWRKGRA